MKVEGRRSCFCAPALALLLLICAGELSGATQMGLHLPLSRSPVRGDSGKWGEPRHKWASVDAEGSKVVPLKGGFDIGEWTVELTLGTPPQTFQVQADTGSSDLLVYTRGCENCEGVGRKFDQGSSRTLYLVPCDSTGDNFHCPVCFRNTDTTNDFLECGFNDAYGSGGANGVVVWDYVGWGGLKANSSFGLIFNSSADFEPNGVEGILGLAYRALSDWNEDTVFHDLAAASGLYNGFSMCLKKDKMVLGANIPARNPFQWTKIINEAWYVVYMEDFKVAGQSLGIPAKVWNDGGIGTIVDSGTTLLLLANQAYEAYANVLMGMCGSTNLVGICNVYNANNSLLAGVCFDMTDDDVEAFPPVSVKLAGIRELVLPPQVYLLPSGDDGQQRCLGIGPVGNIQGPGAILGDVLMINYNVVFDRQNSRIGFGPLSSC